MITRLLENKQKVQRGLMTSLLAKKKKKKKKKKTKKDSNEASFSTSLLANKTRLDYLPAGIFLRNVGCDCHTVVCPSPHSAVT